MKLFKKHARTMSEASSAPWRPSSAAAEVRRRDRGRRRAVAGVGIIDVHRLIRNLEDHVPERMTAEQKEAYLYAVRDIHAQISDCMLEHDDETGEFRQAWPEELDLAGDR